MNVFEFQFDNLKFSSIIIIFMLSVVVLLRKKVVKILNDTGLLPRSIYP